MYFPKLRIVFYFSTTENNCRFPWFIWIWFYTVNFWQHITSSIPSSRQHIYSSESHSDYGGHIDQCYTDLYSYESLLKTYCFSMHIFDLKGHSSISYRTNGDATRQFPMTSALILGFMLTSLSFTPSSILRLISPTLSLWKLMNKSKSRSSLTRVKFGFSFLTPLKLNFSQLIRLSPPPGK